MDHPTQHVMKKVYLHSNKQPLRNFLMAIFLIQLFFRLAADLQFRLKKLCSCERL